MNHKQAHMLPGMKQRNICIQHRLFVGRQDLQVSRLVCFPKLSKQAGEVEWLPAECDRSVPAWPLAGVSVPGQLNPIEIWIVQVDSFMGAVIGCPVDRPTMV